MRRRASALLTLLTCVMPLAACERVVSITLPAGEPRLVVDARIEHVADSLDRLQTVRLTLTDAYFSTGVPPAARGATVEIVDDRGVVTAFAEAPDAPGVFRSSALMLVTRGIYTLRVSWRGDTYVATDTLAAPVPIAALTFQPLRDATRTSELLRTTLGLRDPIGVRNYYLWEHFVDGQPSRSADVEATLRPVISDELIDGFVVSDAQPYADIVVRSGQVIRVRQHSISQAMFSYFTALNEQGTPDGSPFGVPATSLRGNIANRTRPQVFALGYFGVTAVTEAVARVP
jgi:hypothetical protein